MAPAGSRSGHGSGRKQEAGQVAQQVVVAYRQWYAALCARTSAQMTKMMQMVPKGSAAVER